MLILPKTVRILYHGYDTFIMPFAMHATNMPHLRPEHSSQWSGKFELMNILEIQWWLTDTEAWLVKPGSLQADLLLIHDGGSTTCKW
jgi:hypothetical protein